jgi:kinesin family protein 1
MVGFGPNKGIVPIACDEIFKHIEANTDSRKMFQVTISMLEIYNEAVRDLLDKAEAPKGGLQVRQTPKLGVQVVGLKEAAVASFKEIDARMEEGTKRRTIASTNMNSTSSRAHTVVAISFTQLEKDGKGPGKDRQMTSKINLVDLAGSERADSTGATGDRLKEGSAINLSLTMLGNVISALAEKSSNPKAKILIPYRDSKLTMLLSDALGGNSKTIMIAALSPADINYEETLSTLKYADRAKQIKNRAIVNIDPTEQLISRLKEENAKLIKQLEAFSKGGGVDLSLLEGGAPTGPISAEEKERLKKELEEQLRGELEANKSVLEEESKSWQKKYEEATQAFKEVDAKEAAAKERRKTVWHLVNINEDPALAGMVVWFIEAEKTVHVGRSDALPPPEVPLAGLSIQKEHAVLANRGGGAGGITVTAAPGAKVMVNGATLPAGEPRKLAARDRVLFGANHMYVLCEPEAADPGSLGSAAALPTWEEAQEEIARVQGFGVERRDLSHLSQAEREQALLMDEVVRLVPLVNEANAIAEELGKGCTFEVRLLNVPHGLHFKTVPTVQLRHPDTGAQWDWPAPKFLNRAFLFRELYYRRQQGEDVSKVKKEEDPFWEPNDPVLIGYANVYLSPLAYALELDDPMTLHGSDGKDAGLIQVRVHPVNEKGEPDTEVFVEEAKELLGKSMAYRLEVPFARGLNPRFTSVQVRYEWFGEAQAGATLTKPGQNPELKYSQVLKIANIDSAKLKVLEEGLLRLELWGQQSDTKAAGGKAPLAPGAGAAAAASSSALEQGDLRRAATLSKVDNDRVYMEKEASEARLRGERRTIQARINRMLANNRHALAIIDKLVKDKKLPAEAAKELQHALAPGGMAKFKAVAHLLGHKAVLAKREAAAGAGAQHHEENCAHQ